MAKVEVDIDVHENSLDNSGDGEFIGMVEEEGSFGSGEERGSQAYLENNIEESGSYQLTRDSSGTVTYKFIQMATDNAASNVSQSSPSHVLSDGEFFVIGNPVDVFGSSATAKKVLQRDPLQVKAVTTKRRDDKRRATHNEVERRRRDKINSWITKLAALVPNSGLPDSASKGGILAKACDHIAELTEKQKRLEKLEVDNDKLVLEILRLNQEIADLRKDNNSMRNRLGENCIVLNYRPKGQKS